MIQSIRTIRSEMTISPAKAIPLYLQNLSPDIQKRVEKYTKTLTLLSKLTEIRYLTPNDTAPVSASAVVGELELLIPLADLIDKNAELTRLAKELTKLNKDIDFIEGKLKNPNFTDKAPADIIHKEREKLADIQQIKSKLCERQTMIENLA